MKTNKVITIAAIVALAFGTVNFSNAAAKNNAGIVLENVSKINKIEIHGNVQLYVSDGTADQVKVYNNYYSENALVQNQNGVLRISSYKNEKLVVWVTAAQLSSISAYDNSEVQSFGKLAEVDLDVNLYNNATASLNLDGFSANINVNDTAKAELKGNVEQCELKYAQTATVNKYAFAAQHLNVVKTAKPARMSDVDELAALASL